MLKMCIINTSLHKNRWLDFKELSSIFYVKYNAHFRIWLPQHGTYQEDQEGML